MNPYEVQSIVEGATKNTRKNVAVLVDRVNSILDYLIAKYPEDADELRTNKLALFNMSFEEKEVATQ